MLLREVVGQGHSIGQVASVSDDNLRALLRESVNLALGNGSGRGSTRKQRGAAREDNALSGLLAAVGAYDYGRAERELGRLAAATSNPRTLVHRVAFPLMRITGEHCHNGKFTIAQEHMVTSLLSGLFFSMLRLYAPANPPAKVLMATPENEHHGFGILAAAMLTAAGGLGAIHLGTNLPTREIIQAAQKTEADAVILGLRGVGPETAIPILQEIQNRLFPRTQLWVGGGSAQISKAAEYMGWTLLKDFDALERQLGFLGARF